MAGVSYNTVSLVLKDSPLILPETKERVRLAIQKTGYQVNAAAATLRSARSMTLGYVVQREPQEQVDEEIDVFHNRVVKGITEAAEAHRYYVLQTSATDVERCLALIKSGRVDGLLIDMSIPTTVMLELLTTHVPIVVVGRDMGDLPMSWAKADEQQGAYLATKHLLESGHRAIGFLTVDQPAHPIIRDRERGFAQALAEASVPPDATPHFYGDWTFESGYREFLVALEHFPYLTAIFVLNELMAAGCLRAAQERGIHVPEDFSIITIEDSLWVKYVQPQLTAVHVPMYEVGKQATEIMLAMLEDSHDPPVIQQIIVPTTLVIRKSTGPVPQSGRL